MTTGGQSDISSETKGYPAHVLEANFSTVEGLQQQQVRQDNGKRRHRISRIWSLGRTFHDYYFAEHSDSRSSVSPTKCVLPRDALDLVFAPLGFLTEGRPLLHQASRNIVKQLIRYRTQAVEFDDLQLQPHRCARLELKEFADSRGRRIYPTIIST